MKKVVFLLVIFMAVTGAMFAQSAESILGAVPAASYTKSDDNAVWTFAASGITIRDRNGSITISVREMRDLTTITERGAAGFSFAFDTDTYKRTYKILANPLEGTVSLTITRDGKLLDPVTLRKN